MLLTVEKSIGLVSDELSQLIGHTLHRYVGATLIGVDLKITIWVLCNAQKQNTVSLDTTQSFVLFRLVASSNIHLLACSEHLTGNCMETADCYKRVQHFHSVCPVLHQCPLTAHTPNPLPK